MRLTCSAAGLTPSALSGCVSSPRARATLGVRFRLQRGPCFLPARASHPHAIQTGRLSTAAQAAIAMGPSSPAMTVIHTVGRPSAMPAAQAPRR